jgi:rod shape-determining protein MreC
MFPDRNPSLDDRRHGLWLAVVLIVGHVILISTQVSTRAGVPVFSAITFGTMSEVQRGVAGVYGGVTSSWTRYFALRGVEKEAKDLRARLDALELQLQLERARVRRVEELEALLGLRARLVQKTLAAEVIAGDPTGVSRVVVINRGREAGLRADMAVVAPDGVVGRVIEQPALHAARVQLITDRNAGVGALLDRVSAGGVVVGSDGQPPLRLEYVSSDVDVQPGDVVVTSGLDGLYPRGLLVGRVERATKGPVLYREIRLRPQVDFSQLSVVLVILDQVRPPDPGTVAGATR